MVGAKAIKREAKGRRPIRTKGPRTKTIKRNERTLEKLAETYVMPSIAGGTAPVYLRIETREGFSGLLRDIESEKFKSSLAEPNEALPTGPNESTPSESALDELTPNEAWKPRVVMLWKDERRIDYPSSMIGWRGFREACNVYRIDYEKYKSGARRYLL
ncbi:MAG: hypothetical protein J5928_01400 [Firmicutes bacterium]|nr:hypothetical protein [Bacillota bacterium]